MIQNACTLFVFLVYYIQGNKSQINYKGLFNNEILFRLIKASYCWRCRLLGSGLWILSHCFINCWYNGGCLLMREEKRLVTFDDACRTICISATVWDNTKFYKRKTKDIEVVALRVSYYEKYRWTLAITSDNPNNQTMNRFYGIDDYFTQATKLADVLKELELIWCINFFDNRISYTNYKRVLSVERTVNWQSFFTFLNFQTIYQC